MKSDKPPSDKIELMNEATGKGRIDPENGLPNQLPVTGDVPKTSALANATVKWKSRISIGLPPNGSSLDLARQSAGSPSRHPEVVITAAGSQADLDDGMATAGREICRDPDTLSQNSTWTRQSRHESMNGSLHGSRPGSQQGSRPESRNSLRSGRVASALVKMGTGASFAELPNSDSALAQQQISRINNVDNPLVAAIPYLPVKLAWILCLLNVFVPGLGTIIAGFSLPCCGSLQQKNSKDDFIGPFCTNVVVGVSQLFTVTFLLIGWIWSITWGVYMVIFAKENKRVKDEEKRRMHAAKVAKAFRAGRVI